MSKNFADALIARIRDDEPRFTPKERTEIRRLSEWERESRRSDIDLLEAQDV